MYSTWTDKSYNDALKSSNELLKLATDLNESLGSGGGATSPEAVLKALRAINEQVYQLKLAAEFS